MSDVDRSLCTCPKSGPGAPTWWGVGNPAIIVGHGPRCPWLFEFYRSGEAEPFAKTHVAAQPSGAGKARVREFDQAWVRMTNPTPEERRDRCAQAAVFCSYTDHTTERVRELGDAIARDLDELASLREQLAAKTEECAAFQADLARVSSELGLPPTIGPAPGEVARMVAQLASKTEELNRLEEEAERDAFSLTPAMVQARNDSLNKENEALRSQLAAKTEECASLEDMATVGRELIRTTASNCPGWSPIACPSEIVADLVNERDEASERANRILEDAVALVRFIEGFSESDLRLPQVERILLAETLTKEGA